MYHEIGIQKLSPAQISRILNGHGVRVKHGTHHKIHASTEQHKKIMSAHKKGKAHTLTFDPYQIAQHQHLRGHKSHGEGEGVHSRHPVHTLPYHPVHPHHSMGEATYQHRVARRARNTFKPMAQLAHYAIPATLGALGGIAGTTLSGSPFGGIAGKMAGSYAGDKLNRVLGVGEGIKRRGRPRKHPVVHHKSYGEGKARGRRGRGEGFGEGFGEGEGIKRRGRKSKGEGEGIKRRGRKSHGEALYPAGYGEGEGFGEGFGEGDGMYYR